MKMNESSIIKFGTLILSKKWIVGQNVNDIKVKFIVSLFLNIEQISTNYWITQHQKILKYNF